MKEAWVKNSFLLSAWALSSWLLLCPLLSAQERADQPAPSKPAKNSTNDKKTGLGQVEQVKPSVTFLKDAQGNLQQVIDMAYEDYVRLWHLDKQLTHPDQPPRYSLQRFTVRGIARQGQAVLEVEAKILTHDSAWVRVPLKLNSAVLKKPAGYEGPGQHFMQFDKQGDGYVAWIRGPADKTHTLSLSILVPLAQLGDQTRLTFSAPASTSSQLHLRVPASRATGTVSQGASLLAPKYPSTGQTEFTVLGLGGDVQLTWHQAKSSPSQAPPVLEARGSVLVRIEGQNGIRIRSEARLTVQSHGGEMDTIRVSLPPGAKVIPGKAAGYEIVEVKEAQKKEAEKNKPQWVDIKLDKKTKGPQEIVLTTELVPAAGQMAQPIQLAGFEVLGAVRQWGHIALAMGEDWFVDWDEGRNVRQVSTLPDLLQQAPRQMAIITGFQYTAQPFSLNVKVLPREKQVQVEPLYLLKVQADQVQLEARLSYTVRGAKVKFLHLDLAGWQIDDLEPKDVVDHDAIRPERAKSPLVIPLMRARRDRFDLVLRAHRKIDRGASLLRLPLPRPRESTLQPATVVVLPDDNVVLVPRADKMQGLSPADPLAQLDLPPRQQKPFYYSDQADQALSTFVSDFRVQTRSVSVDIAGQVTLDVKQAEIEQTFSYRIAYAALNKISLTASPSLLASVKPKILLDGQALAEEALQIGSAVGGGKKAVEAVVLLPEARIGPCELVIRYTLPISDLQVGNRTELNLPLFGVAGETKIQINTLRVKPSDTVNVELREGDWATGGETAVTDASNGTTLQLIAQRPTMRLLLKATLLEPKEQGSTVIDKAWVQTWLTPSVRQDRAVYRLSTQERAIQVVLPPGVLTTDVVATLDGMAVSIAEDNPRTINVPLPADAGRRQYLLELSYTFSKRPSTGRRVSLELPRMTGAGWVKKMYWQLIIPTHEHLLSNPAGLTPEMAWGWRRMFWQRRANLSQQQLETWIGASIQTGPGTTNQYLFSTFGTPRELEKLQVRTDPRSLILLVASGVVLVGGLLLIYFPAVRRPWLFLVGGIALAAGSLLWPTAALIMAQASALGFALASVALILMSHVRRRRASRSVIRGMSAPSADRDSTQTRLMRSEGSSFATTATAPISIQMSDSSSPS